MLSTLRSDINKNLVKLDMEEVRLEELNIFHGLSLTAIQKTERAQLVMQKAAKMSQDHLAAHLSNIVTQAIQVVIQKPYQFVCEFVERRGSTEADLYLVKDGERFDILAGTGGGLADVCSFSLKVAYLLLSNMDRVLVIDEICRHINSPSQRKAFMKVVKGLSEEFGIQLIINSALPEVVAMADKLITVSQGPDEISKIS